MIESLATIMSHFSGEANRARCLAHIVNLVAKIILRQFDRSKIKKKNNPPENDIAELPNVAGPGDNNIVDDEEDDFDDEMDRVLDKEEKEMDEGGDDEDEEDDERLERDAEIMEEAMEEEIKRVAKKVKPVRQALFKVCPFFFFFF